MANILLIMNIHHSYLAYTWMPWIPSHKACLLVCSSFVARHLPVELLNPAKYVIILIIFHR